MRYGSWVYSCVVVGGIGIRYVGVRCVGVCVNPAWVMRVDFVQLWHQ